MMTLSLIFYIGLVSLFSMEQQLARADIDEELPDPKFTPSPIYNESILLPNNSFKRQPNKTNNKRVGDKLTLSVEPIRSWGAWAFAPRNRPKYSWYIKKSSTTPWTLINNENESSLNINLNSPGKFWIQAVVIYDKTFILDSLIKRHELKLYSTLSEITVSSKSHYAGKITVNTNRDYLFYGNNDLVNNSAIAEASLTPKNSNSPVTWSLKSDVDNLATINPESGEIKSNNSNNSGDVTVIGTARNDDGTSVSDSKIIHIGGGLQDITANSGDDINIGIQNGSPDTNKSDDSPNIDWYIKDPLKPAEGFKKNKSLSNKPSFKSIAKASDNGKQYYAIISMPGQKKHSSYKTNTATLTVYSPDINIKTSIVNNGNQNKLKSKIETNLNNVIENDELEYHTVLTNNSRNDIKESHFDIPLHLDTEINEVKIDNKIIAPLDSKNKSGYSLSLNKDSSKLILNIPTNDLKSQLKKEINIITNTKNVLDRDTIYTKPHFQGWDSQNKLYENSGDSIPINYMNNKINIVPKNIVFDQIIPFDMASYKHRTNDTNTPNEILKIDDQRRILNGSRIYLIQDDDFTNNQSNKKSIEQPLLDLRLHQDTNDKNGTSILRNKQLVQHSTLGEKMTSLFWGKDEGLLLHLNKQNIPAGNYSTKLTWTIVDSTHG